MSDIRADAHAVMLPAIADLALTPALQQFLDQGGCSLLLGETREEYVARRMTPARIGAESREAFASLAAEIRRRAGPSLIAVDQEPAGIARLHRLVPGVPGRAQLVLMADAEIEAACRAAAAAALAMGVNLFLAPIGDVVSGRNVWLEGRNLGADPAVVARIAAAAVRGFQAAGVRACAKHFPGHHDIDHDPAIAEATVSGGAAQLEPGLAPFRGVIAAGVGAIMLGPALVPAIDAAEPSSTSAKTVRMLRADFAFGGLIVSDDLDAEGILRGRPLAETAIAALKAGAELLLVAAGDHLAALSAAIVRAVESGQLDREKLARAAARVREYAGGMPLQRKDEGK